MHYLLNSYNYNKQIFSSYQLSSPKVVQLFNFSPQLFKTYFPIFQVSQADFCPESCKRSQIYAGSIPDFVLCLIRPFTLSYKKNRAKSLFYFPPPKILFHYGRLLFIPILRQRGAEHLAEILEISRGRG